MSQGFTRDSLTLVADSGGNLVGTSFTLAGGNGIATSGSGTTITTAMSSPFTGDFTFTDSTAADTQLLTISNTDNTGASASSAALAISVGGSTQIGDPHLYFATGSTRSFCFGSDTSDSQTLKINTDSAGSVTPSSGTNLMSITSAGAVSISAGDLTVERSQTAGDVRAIISNTDNTSAGSDARLRLKVGGTSSGSAMVIFDVPSTNQWSIGLDNGASDKFRIAHSDGALDTNTIMDSTVAGEIIFPLQPAFLGYQASNAASATGNGTSYQLGSTVDLTEIFDQNSDFDETTGTFTAPITGRYLLTAKCVFNAVTSTTEASITITTSNRTYVTTNSYASGATNNKWAQCSFMVDMDASDTATVSVYLTGAGADNAGVYGEATNVYTGFGGALIC